MSLFIVVKTEPVESSESSEQAIIETVAPLGEPEFVNIKTEDGVPDLSIKEENTTGDENRENRGDESIEQDESRVMLVEVKTEPVDHFDENFLSGFGNDVPSVEQPHSSSNYYSNVTDEILNQNSTVDGKYICPVCNKRFANKGNVQRHLLLHNKDIYNCQTCFKQYRRKELLDKHMVTHTNERTYACDECEKKFKTSSNLMQHKKSHLAVKPFFCEQCHRSFAIKSNLVKHQGKSRCKRPIDEPIKCTICNKVFQKEFLLKSHLRRHTSERPYCCDHCNMTFKYKSTLIRHIQLHDGIRPFACKFCKKSFTHSALLKPHMRTHTGEKPYKCLFCSKHFSHKHNMQRHALRHNRIKNLVCEICNKKFPKESRLKYHMRIHVDQKYFSCYVCPKKFSHRQNVLRHYTRKHPNCTYECTDTDASVALKVWDACIKSKQILDGYVTPDSPEEILG